MKVIRFTIVVVVMFCVGAALHASECGVVKTSDSDVSFNFNFGFVNYTSGHYGLIGSINDVQARQTSNEQKADNFRNMGIAGAVVTGVGLLMTIIGAVLVGVGYSQMIAAGTAFSISALAGGALLVLAGAVVLAFGQIIFWVGLPLLIVGFVLSRHFRNRSASLQFEQQDKSFSQALVFKL